METSGNPSSANRKCLTSDIAHPALDYNSSRFHGNRLSFIEFTLDEEINIDEFTFLFFVSPVGDEGTLFHYKNLNVETETGLISDIVVFFDHTNVYLHVFGDNLTEVVGNISIQNNFELDEWKQVTVEYEGSLRRFFIAIGANSEGQMLQIQRHVKLPGKIRIGGSFMPEYSPYNGRTTCLQIYYSKLGNGNSNVLDRCMSTTWPLDLLENTGENYATIMSFKNGRG